MKPHRVSLGHILNVNSKSFKHLRINFVSNVLLQNVKSNAYMCSKMNITLLCNTLADHPPPGGFARPPGVGGVEARLSLDQGLRTHDG